MNKITLKIDFDIDGELDFILIGISTSLRDYRLCHFINKQTGLKLIFGKESHLDHNKKPKKSKNLDELDYHVLQEKNKNKKEVVSHYQVYRDCNDIFEYEYYLVSNKSLENTVLIPEAPHFDYFLLIKHYIDREDLAALIEQIKSIPEIILIKKIDPITLKSKENLIF